MGEHIKQCREVEKLKNLPLLWELRSNYKKSIYCIYKATIWGKSFSEK